MNSDKQTPEVEIKKEIPVETTNTTEEKPEIPIPKANEKEEVKAEGENL